MPKPNRLTGNSKCYRSAGKFHVAHCLIPCAYAAEADSSSKTILLRKMPQNHLTFSDNKRNDNKE